MATELKPCPFCGGPAELFEWDKDFGVRCTDPHCIGHDFDPCYWDEEYATEAWNRRAEE